MAFLSASFAALLASVLVAFYSLPPARRWMPLLVGSFVFYWSWSPGFSWLVLLLTGVTYLAGLSRPTRPILLSIAVVFCVVIVAIFKVPGLFPKGFIAPIGFSFFTLQAIAYLIEVRRGTVAPERHFGRFALFLCFFPQLLAGPIERPGRLLPQLSRLDARFDGNRLRIAALLIFAGLFKKLVIGESLAVWVDPVFRDPASHSVGAHALATLLGRYRIYCDFSGYTDVALGLASLFGVTLMANFDRPFASASLAEFWRRWHISLSSWMRDYVYFPLLASPFSRAGLLTCLCVTFAALGLWHGGTANFLLFGIVQGILIWSQHKASRLPVFTRLRSERPGLSRALAVAFTFLFLICLPTVLFLTPDLQSAATVYAALLGLIAPQGAPVDLASPLLIKVAVLIAGLELLQFLHGQSHLGRWLETRPVWVRWGIMAAGGSLFLVLANFGKPLDFIYRHF